MPRQARLDGPGALHHIMGRGIDKSKIFKDGQIGEATAQRKHQRPLVVPSSWAFDPVRGVRVIGFDVTVDGKPYGEANAGGLKWLQDDLNENKSKKLIIVFTHQLVMPTTPRDNTPEWSFWMVRNHEKLRSFLEQYPNVRLVVSGHHHASQVTTAGRVTYVSDPAIVTYPCAFRYFSVSKEGIHLRNIGLDDKASVNRAFELLVTDPYARMYDPAAPQKAAEYSIGLTEKDRETTIKL